MNVGTWVGVFLPLFLLFFASLPQQNAARKSVISKIQKRKGVIIMSNEIIKKYIGKNCIISTGTFGINVVGKIISVEENWIEVETKKGNELINAEFVQSIKIKSN
ncbi:hypothetical protein [Oceanirhabdus seepicola]|nr:hypothetical protein [Oceanirhabdus seepicola]